MRNQSTSDFQNFSLDTRETHRVLIAHLRDIRRHGSSKGLTKFNAAKKIKKKKKCNIYLSFRSSWLPMPSLDLFRHLELEVSLNVTKSTNEVVLNQNFGARTPQPSVSPFIPYS